MNDVSATALFTLRCHALDAASRKSILNDVSAVRTIELIQDRYGYVKMKKPEPRLVAYIVLRAQKFDQVVRDFIQKHPNAVVVNIGCGLDNRFERVDNKKILYYDLDLPDIISIKKEIFPETDRYKYFSTSVFSTDWIQEVPKDRPVLFLAEGVFMYCEESDVRSLFGNLEQHFQSFEFLFEVVKADWLKGWKYKIIEFKMRRELKFGSTAVFRFGLPDSRTLESWRSGYKLLEEWSSLDSNHPQLGALRFFRNFDWFRHTLWSVHYAYNEASEQL